MRGGVGSQEGRWRWRRRKRGPNCRGVGVGGSCNVATAEAGAKLRACHRTHEMSTIPVRSLWHPEKLVLHPIKSSQPNVSNKLTRTKNQPKIS